MNKYPPICALILMLGFVTDLQAQELERKKSSTQVFKKWTQPKTGDVHLLISKPEGNHFVFKRSENYESYVGLTGGIFLFR